MLATKVVQLSRGCEDRLATCLGLPRAGALAVLEGAPYSNALTEYLAENVEDVKQIAIDPQRPIYLPLKVNSVETVVGTVKKSDKLSRNSILSKVDAGLSQHRGKTEDKRQQIMGDLSGKKKKTMM